MPAPQQPTSRFRRIRKLGSGGSGDVWLVRGRDESTPIALKQLPLSDADQVASLRSEFALIASLSHPNLAEVYEFGVGSAGAGPYYTLEFVDGDDLPATVRREGPQRLPDLLVECLRALSFLHDFGILHRDLKPGNLLVRGTPRRGGRVVLLDFGLALQGSAHDVSAGPVGTLPYLAPELLHGGRASRRSDLYALGLVAHEALYGVLPVPFDPGDVSGYFEAVQERRRDRGPVPGAATAGLAAWIELMIDPDPGRRPASAADALGRLRQDCGGNWPLDVSATRLSRLRSGEPPGRGRALESIRNALRMTQRGVGVDAARIVWLVGDAGIGKSRVLRWMAVEAVRGGWQVIDDPHQLDVAAGEPFGEAHLAALRDRASGGPLLLLIDELERRPAQTTRLLARIATEPDASPLRVLVGARVAEVQHPAVKSLIANSDLLPTCARIRLPPLDLEGVAEFARRAGIETTLDGRQSLLERSEGNPLALEAMVTGEAPTTPDGGDGAATLAGYVASRIRALSGPARAVCRVLAILERGSIVTLTTLCGPREATTAALGELVDAGLAVRERDEWRRATRLADEYFRAHSRGLYRQAARRVAEGLDADGSAGAGRLARLWAEVGEAGRAHTLALRASESCERAAQFAEAADWVGLALRQLPRRHADWPALRRRHAALLYRSARFALAAKAHAAVARRATDCRQRIVSLARQVECLVRARRLSAAGIVAATATRFARENADDRMVAYVTTARALLLLTQGRLEACVRTADGAIRTLDGTDHTRPLAQALVARSVALYQLRRLDEARAAGDRAVTTARRARLTLVLGEALVARLNPSISLEPVHALERPIEVARRFLVRTKQERLLPALLSAQYLVLRRAARYDAALRLIARLEPRAIQSMGRDGYFAYRIKRAEILAEAGRPMEASAILSELLADTAGYSPREVHVAWGTLAEALLEQEAPPLDRVGRIVNEQLDAVGDNFYLRAGLLTVELDRRSRPGCDASFEETWARYGELDLARIRAIEPEFYTRATLAHAAWLNRAGRAGESIDLLREAVSLAGERGFIVLLARAWGLTADARAQRNEHPEARDALQRARGTLDEAARRIGDEQIRIDFRAHPRFASIRHPPWARKEAEKDRLMAIYRMIHALNSESDPDLVLESILDMALDVVRAERGLILLRDRAGEEFRVRVARNLEKETIADAAEVSRNVVRAAGAGKAVLSIDTEHDDRFRDFKSVSMYGIRAVICVPLRSRGKIIGVVYLDSRSGGALFAERELEFLEAFADHAALALGNARIRDGLERTNRRLQVAAQERVRFGEIVGESAAMQAVYDLVTKVTQVQVPVLIQGESGTGKELVARSIHFNGPRKRRPFLSENCAAIPESLLESELFGHVKGAFTGADRDRVGLFQQADTGTLFLDEVGDMPAPMQARLLRVLQQGEVRRVGGEQTLHVDVRIIAATNRDLAAEVEAGRFREDLLYRLQVLLIELPPLRERIGDVPLLVEHMLARIGAARGRPAPAVRAPVLDLLERFHWPGNVRQLENTLQRLVVLAGDDPITVDLVEADKTLGRLLIDSGKQPQAMFSLEQNEKDQIRAALRRTAGNRAKAARLLGISRATIFRKIKGYRLH